MSKIFFAYGETKSFDELNNNVIALDGYCSGGPRMDPETRRFNFDHHEGCQRMATLATCQQVLVAIDLGLGAHIDENTVIAVNDIDADSVLAAWLILHHRQITPEVREVVRRVGLTDAHGPIFPPHPIHFPLSPRNRDDQTPEKLAELLNYTTLYFQGEIELSERPQRTSKCLIWNPTTGWTQGSEVDTGFQGVYAQGAYVGILYQKLEDGTWMYTVGKRSDLVPYAVGPSHDGPREALESIRTDTLLGVLAGFEINDNPDQPLSSNWGGATTVGGSPRNADRSGSRLSPERVLEICRAFDM